MVNVNYISDRLAHRVPMARRAGLVERQDRAKPEVPATPGLTVAMAREPGTPADEIARELGARLGWPVYNHELLDQISQEMHVPVSHLENIDERGQNWLLECIRGFSLVAEVSEEAYVHRLAGLIRSLGARRRCILVGRGAAQILPAEYTLRVSLVGRREDRIAALSRDLHVGAREAARKAEEIDQERIRFVRNHFHKDPLTADNYDLILNTSRWSPAECAALIERAIYEKARSDRAE